MWDYHFHLITTRYGLYVSAHSKLRGIPTAKMPKNLSDMKINYFYDASHTVKSYLRLTNRQ